MRKVSYAQNREDMLLARALPDEKGFYIDIGAAEPLAFSVTKHFYERGWSGVNVEPQDDYFRQIVADRPRDINLQLVVSDKPGTFTLHIAPTHPGWATTCADVAAQMSEQGIALYPREVRAITLAELCAIYVRGTIDFLKIDVEGAERAVLLGGDFYRWRPRIVLLEATVQGSPTPNHHLWEDVILRNDYLFATFDGLNRYYVRAEEPELVPILQVPVNVFDDFAPFEFQSRIWELEAREKNLREIAERVTSEASAAQQELTALRTQLAEVEKTLAVVEGERNGAWVEGERLRAELDALSRDYAETVGRETDARRRLHAARQRVQSLRGVLQPGPIGG